VIKPISDQVIVIVGASSGIGLAVAQMAAQRGAKVVLAARNAEDLEVAELEINRNGGDAIAVEADVTSYEDMERLARITVEKFGRIDTWVNNAAVSAYVPFMEMSLEDFQQIIDTNFMGQVYGARVALPYLEQTEGALICVGSTLSDRGVPLQSAYCAAKHAIKGWLDSLRVELLNTGSNVRLTLIKPSSINTPLFNKAKTALGVMPQPIPPVYDPELAVEAILRAATSNERDVFVGGAGKFLSMAERVSPKLVDIWELKGGIEGQKTTWPKRADAPHNLYEPVRYDGGVYGDFRRGVKHRSAYQTLDAHVVRSALAGAAIAGTTALVLRRGGKRAALPALLAAATVALTGKALLAQFFER